MIDAARRRAIFPPFMPTASEAIGSGDEGKRTMLRSELLNQVPQLPKWRLLLRRHSPRLGQWL